MPDQFIFRSSQKAAFLWVIGLAVLVEWRIQLVRAPLVHFKAHHVIHRGYYREACFGDETGYKTYLTYINESVLLNGVAIVAG